MMVSRNLKNKTKLKKTQTIQTLIVSSLRIGLVFWKYNGFEIIVKAPNDEVLANVCFHINQLKKYHINLIEDLSTLCTYILCL